MASIDEIKDAVQNCDSSKALGYDGFHMNFIKNMWHELEFDMVRFIYDFF